MNIGFYTSLHKFAQRRAKDLTDPGDEGTPAVRTTLQPIASNWPWLYVDFKVVGKLYLQELRRLDDAFQLFCREHKVSFQELTISSSVEHPGSVMVRVKLVYRDDLDR